jgi:predicted HicB family RNase H-like nuclease
MNSTAILLPFGWLFGVPLFYRTTNVKSDRLLEVCKEKGISPRKEYSGKFNLRIPPRLHSEIAAQATAAGKSINQWVSEILERSTSD